MILIFVVYYALRNRIVYSTDRKGGRMNNSLSPITDLKNEFELLIKMLDKIEIDKCEEAFNSLFERSLPYYIDEQISYAYDLFLIYDLDNSAAILKNVIRHLNFYCQ